MEPDQINVLPAAVTSHVEQVLHARETGFTREIDSDIGGLNRRDRVHHDMAMPILERVPAIHFDVRPLPEADGALHPAAPDALEKVFAEYHPVTCAAAARGRAWRSVFGSGPCGRT